MSFRSFLAFAHDGVAAVVAWCVAYLLRFNLEIPRFYLDGMLQTLLW